MKCPICLNECERVIRVVIDGEFKDRVVDDGKVEEYIEIEQTRNQELWRCDECDVTEEILG